MNEKTGLMIEDFPHKNCMVVGGSLETTYLAKTTIAFFRNTSSRKKSSRNICRHLKNVKTVWKTLSVVSTNRQISHHPIQQYHQYRPLAYTSMDSLFGVGTGRQFIGTAAILLHAVVWFLTGTLGVMISHFCTQMCPMTMAKPLQWPFPSTPP